ncbi:attachment protein [Candidatus Pantoea formicae]|uniref:attachment protein n=1 Tax=Candidatus Pantoea formicae TaxID=2608355 RepID=UPI003ED8DEC1
MKRIILLTLLLLPLLSQADTTDLSSSVQPKYKTNYTASPITYTVTQDSIDEACQSAKTKVSSQSDSFITTMKKTYPDYVYSTSFSECNTSKVSPGDLSLDQLGNVVVTATVSYTEPSDSGSSASEQCSAQSPMQDTFNNVVNGSYINYNGCQYEATGVIVCNNSKTVCAATWKPTGIVSSSDSTESTVSDSSDLSDGADSDGSNSGDTSEGSSNNSSSGSAISKDDMTSAVKEGLISASPTVADEFKSKFTENDTSSEDKESANELSESNIKKLEDNLNNTVRGAGKFADPDQSVGRYGDGSSEMDLAVSQASSQIGIDKDSYGSSWASFMNDGALLPSIPHGNGCSPFIMFPGQVYQMEIDCDKLGDIKSVLSWVMYCLTFWNVFTSLTSLLRKGDE